MKNAPSKFSTVELVTFLKSPAKEDDDRNYIYEAEQCLFKRWRSGADIEPLINILHSEKSRDRLLGAYYLCELAEPVEGLKIPVLRLSDDSISHCRRAFVEFMASARYYDDPIGIALGKCLLDLDLYVRVSVLRWGIQTSTEQFEHFSRLVEAGAGGRKPKFHNPLNNDYWNESELKRRLRGLNIIRRIRTGEEIPQIRGDFPEEDSFVFDSIDFVRTLPERNAKWKDIRRSRTDS